MLVSDSLACSDPQVGDSVEKGRKVRTVIARNGNDIRYKTENGLEKECFITTWQSWCRDATKATTVGNGRQVALGVANKQKKLRVWWIPQVPMKAFHVDVSSVEDGVKILGLLADYDAFQFENNVKGDYSNVGGLEEFDPTDKEDGLDGSWVSWCDDETGIDDPSEYLEFINPVNV